MTPDAYEILHTTRDADLSKLQADADVYDETLAAGALESAETRLYYESARAMQLGKREVPVCAAENQLTWEKDGPQYFKFWASQLPNKPLKLDFASITLLGAGTFGSVRTLQLQFDVTLRLHCTRSQNDKKTQAEFQQNMTATKRLTVQVPYSGPEELRAAFPQTPDEALTALEQQLPFMQNSAFRAKETGETVEIELSEHKERIAMRLAVETALFEQQMAETFHLYEPEAFERTAEFCLTTCQILHNNCIVQQYKLEKTPRALAMNLVNGVIVGKAAESKIKTVFAGLFGKKKE